MFIMAFGSDQSDELSVLKGDDGSVSPQRNGEKRLTVQLEYFDRLVLAWIRTRNISKVYSC